MSGAEDNGRFRLLPCERVDYAAQCRKDGTYLRIACVPEGVTAPPCDCVRCDSHLMTCYPHGGKPGDVR